MTGAEEPAAAASRAPTPAAERLVALALVAVGSLLVLSSASRPRVSVGGAALEHGQADVPAATALALAALAGAAATLLLRGPARNVVGVLIGAAGLVVAVLNQAARDDVSTVTLTGDAPSAAPTPWFWMTAAGAALLVVGGAVMAARAHRWPSSRRDYGTPAGRRPTRADAWSALDRGEDPTV
jgi:Tryptophan-associated transmembrane protein (Trp_oprn_chp)